MEQVPYKITDCEMWGVVSYDGPMENNICCPPYLSIALLKVQREKSRIWETKHLSTDADSSTDTTVGWTKNTQKPKFIEKPTKSSKTENLKNV